MQQLPGIEVKYQLQNRRKSMNTIEKVFYEMICEVEMRLFETLHVNSNCYVSINVY